MFDVYTCVCVSIHVVRTFCYLYKEGKNECWLGGKSAFEPTFSFITRHHYNVVRLQVCYFSCNQAALWMVQSVRPSGCPSVRHTFLTMFSSSYHHEIFRSYYQWQKWRPYKRSRSKVKVTEVTTELNRFRTVTPVWILIWWWNDAYSLTMLRRGALLFFKVIPSNFKVTRLKKKSILTPIGRFRTVTPVWIHQWLRNAAQSFEVA